MRRRVGRELEPAGERHGRRAVLDAEDELAVAAAEIEVAIAPSVQVPRAASAWPSAPRAPAYLRRWWTRTRASWYARWSARAARRGPRTSRPPSFRRSGAGAQADRSGGAAGGSGRGSQAGAIARGIETEGRRDDEAEVEIAEAEAAGGGDRREARAQVGGGVLGAVEEDGAGLRHGEATERRGAGRDRDRDVEGEPGLPVFPTLGAPLITPTPSALQRLAPP